MTDRLRTDDERRRELLADVAHELRTPLQVIRGSVEGMLDGLYPIDEDHLVPVLEETRVLARLVEDVSRLLEQQRSALLMREIDGMSYADLASALDVTVPAVKSLLVRARVGLVEAAEARDADCC